MDHTIRLPSGRAVGFADHGRLQDASHGIDGGKIVESAQGPPLARSDLAMLVDHPFGRHWLATRSAMFAQGLEGYTDDRLADGGGWDTFDVAAGRWGSRGVP